MIFSTAFERYRDAQRQLRLNHLCQYVGARQTPPNWGYLDRLQEEAQALAQALPALRDASEEEAVAAAEANAYRDDGPPAVLEATALDELDF